MRLLQTILICFLALASGSELAAQGGKLAMAPATGNKVYHGLPIGELNTAQRQLQNGQFDLAYLTYNAALASQPDWVPALAGRARILIRLGRDAEARRDRLHATRINATATGFYLAQGRNALMPYLALYPADYYFNQYALEGPLANWERNTHTGDFFTEQYDAIQEATDTSVAMQALRQKVDHDVVGSQQTIDDLPRNYSTSVRDMLNANLAMLNHNYTEAVNLYSTALRGEAIDWPELHYNRGLAHILLYNYVSGCEDLENAASANYGPAVVMLDCLCNL